MSEAALRSNSAPCADEGDIQDHFLHSFWTTVTTLSRTQRLFATR